MTATDFRIGVLGSGSGTNFEAIAEACAKGQVPGRIALVLSDIADAKILERARRRSIEARFIGPSQFKTKLEPELEESVAQQLLAADVHLVALAGYMRVVKTPLLRAFPGRMMNIHPSLLPSFPGLRAWEQALAYGAKVTGCTVHLVNDGVDQGPIILQKAVPILESDTPATLHERIHAVEHELYPRAIRLFAEGKLQVAGRAVKILES